MKGNECAGAFEQVFLRLNVKAAALEEIQTLPGLPHFFIECVILKIAFIPLGLALERLVEGLIPRTFSPAGGESVLFHPNL